MISVSFFVSFPFPSLYYLSTLRALVVASENLSGGNYGLFRDTQDFCGDPQFSVLSDILPMVTYRYDERRPIRNIS